MRIIYPRLVEILETEMNQHHLNAMIEQATPQERCQFKATANVHLNTLREKMRREQAIAERKEELGDK